MREALTATLRCPRCTAEGSMRLDPEERDAREVRTGELRCASCEQTYRITGGIVDLLLDPPPFVVREAGGLERFAALMRSDGWDQERVLALPDVDLPYWHGQRRAMDALLARVPIAPGTRLLDVGANTCWASRIFASRGVEVVALDIATVPMQGLGTADWAFAAGEPYFERVLSLMSAPALASASFDYVFCCEVVHHNDRDHMRRTFAELYRVLRPGGRLFLASEPLRFPFRLKRDHGREVEAFEGNEHVYFLHEYALAARRAGFEVDLVDLPTGRGRTPRALARWVWRQLLRGDGHLTMDCTKPA